MKKKTNKTKKKVTRTTSKTTPILKPAPKGKSFFLANGEEVKSAKTLADKLEEMPEEVFKHHVNQEKNDFANWIKDIFKAEDLASKMNSDRKDIRIEIYKYLLSKKR